MTAQTPDPNAPRVPLANKAQPDAEAQAETIIKAKQCFDRIGKTEDGLHLLKYIYALTGYRHSPVVISRTTHDVSIHTTLLFQGRGEVWRDLRAMLSDELFCKIETQPIADPVKVVS